MKRHALALAAVLSALSILTTTALAQTLSETSQARARQVLDRAVAALGGAEVIRSIDGLKLEMEGDLVQRLQMPTPKPPFEPGYFRESLLLDLKNNRLRLEQTTRSGGFETQTATVIQSGEGVNYDLRARTATPVPPAQATQQQFVQYYRRLPNLIVAQALDRAGTLRYLGEATFEERRHEVITFVMADALQVALYVDATSGLVSKYELIFTDPLRGEQPAEVMYSDYARVGKMMVPQLWTWRVAGDQMARYKVKAEFNPAGLDKGFAFAADGFKTVAPMPFDFKQSVEQLADGVYVFHNVPGPNQNSMAVAFKDHVVVVEAPGSSAGADALIARIKETIPGKPIRYVAVTHHHGDHIGGLRSFIAEGATVITTPGNRALIEEMAAARQLDRLGANPRKPQFLIAERERTTLTDGSRRVELIQVGPNAHAREMLVAWLPNERVLFQGDLFGIPPNNALLGPPQPLTVSFAKTLKDLALPVERIASVHGRTATIAEFNRALDEGVAKN
jgi:glyoxylase-like metal-dependent hydrolase (beta-lactamase superfamily II)